MNFYSGKTENKTNKERRKEIADREMHFAPFSFSCNSSFSRVAVPDKKEKVLCPAEIEQRTAKKSGNFPF